MNTLRWFGRWMIWVFIIAADAENENLAEHAAFTRGVFFAFGSVALMMALACGLFLFAASLNFDVLALGGSVALVVYLSCGLLLYLIERRDYPPPPWYYGAW